MKEAILDCIERTRTFLFSGPRGCGKTTLARLIAYQLNINDADIHEIDAADKTGVDDARQIKSSASYAPMGGKRKIYIIDECHRLSGNAWDSLLKTLEQPPNHCYFVLCTTEINKVPTTIKSRSKMFEVKPLMRKEAEQLIDWICQGEGITISPTVKKAIIDNCEGISREIIVCLDTVRNIREEDALALISSPRGEASVLELCQALLKSGAKWSAISKIVQGVEEEPEKIRYAVLSYMSKVLLNAENDRAASLIQIFQDSWMYTGKSGLVLSCYLATKL